MNELNAREAVAILRTIQACDLEDLDAIQEMPYSVEVRTAWHELGSPATRQYRLMLAGGVPTVYLVGNIDEDGVPCTAQLDCGDGFLPVTEKENEALVNFAANFHFGESA